LKMPDPIQWYETHAAEVSSRYEAAAPEALHAWLIDMLPRPPALILDVGAGTGRDAAWLAARGYDVVAAEPSEAMRAEAKRLHPAASIRWVADALPDLSETLRLGLAFDLILLSAVWMHVPPGDRDRAFRKLVNLVKPGGLIVITLRMRPEKPERGMHPALPTEIERLAREHRAFVERLSESPDQLGRADVQWTQLAVRLPDDGTGALPLLRHIILNDDKSSTYKLALLRTICRIADGAAGYAREANDNHVAIPLGLAGLYWIRLFKPLLAADLPQTPRNRHDEGLGFVKEGFRGLADISHNDLHIGMSFAGDRAAALHSAVRDACDTITRMPAHYTVYPNGGPIFPATRVRNVSRPHQLRLDEAYALSFGELFIPRHLWRALQRFDVWIEPALTSEWSRLMNSYAERQGRSLDNSIIGRVLTWSDPTRDVRIAKQQALRLIERSDLHCVWTGSVLSTQNLDIDHCFPWAAWPCDDLWNLVPTRRSVNNQKRDRLPSNAVLQSAHDRILAWWNNAYLQAGNPSLAERFRIEVRASLPTVKQVEFRLDDLFAALTVQRLRIKHDQQVPEWSPVMRPTDLPKAI
jgi:SAM-dependent methyltransferase